MSCFGTSKRPFAIADCRRFRLAAVFCAAAALGSTALNTASEAAAADSARPLNVVLIVADDLGWADLGCYGSKFHRTPHLDELAANGVRFTNGYAACPVCSPTRAAILTGRYPARLHLTDWLPGRGNMPSQQLNRPQTQQQLPLEETTLAEVLQSRGYATASIGKWHLGGTGFEPAQQGFDLNVAGDAAGSPLSYFAPYVRQTRSMPGLDSAPAGEYLTDRLTDEALKFIEAHAEQPFFLYLPHFAVHIPLRAKEAVVSKYPAESPFRGVQNNPVYAAMIESLDDSVGRITARLAELGLDEQTIVVFTSDNGGLCVLEGPHTPATSNAPLREGKGFLYEGGIRVPLIIKWPQKGRSGVESHAPACSIDLFPTLLEFCGAETSVDVDGVSLAAELTGGSPLERDALYWHYPHYANQGGRPGGAVRAGDLKLIEFYETGRRELFDLRKDPGEGRNLAADRPDDVSRLAEMLAQWRTRVDAQMPTQNPDYAPNPQNEKGEIHLPARTAVVQGTMLRYEPMPHKETLGYWVRQEDFATWDFTVRESGSFTLEALIGCGAGSGGSEVEFNIGEQTLAYTVEETGHFQNFVPRKLGTVTITTPGRHTLSVKAKTKPGVAVMDLRRVVLTPSQE